MNNFRIDVNKGGVRESQKIQVLVLAKLFPFGLYIPEGINNMRKGKLLFIVSHFIFPIVL